MSKTRVRLSKDSKLEDLNNMGTSIMTNGKTYHFFPFWIEDDGGDLFIHSLGDLPEELKEAIEEIRDKKEDGYLLFGHNLK